MLKDQQLIYLIAAIGKQIKGFECTKGSVEKGIEPFKNLIYSKQNIEQDVSKLINYIKDKY